MSFSSRLGTISFGEFDEEITTEKIFIKDDLENEQVITKYDLRQDTKTKDILEIYFPEKNVSLFSRLTYIPPEMTVKEIWKDSLAFGKKRNSADSARY